MSILRRVAQAGFVFGVTALLSAPRPGASPPESGAQGVVEGEVRVPSPPPRRTADRYGGPGAGRGGEVQSVPSVVYLDDVRPVTPPSPPATPRRMEQRDTLFHPPVLVVPPGSRVEFPNEDPFFHNVFSYSSIQRFDLGRYPRGESKGVVFEEPGIARIYCEVHESMRGVVVVLEHSYHAQPDEDGAFRIEGVPPGIHRVVAWHADHGSVEADVEVPEGGVARVSLTF